MFRLLVFLLHSKKNSKICPKCENYSGVLFGIDLFWQLLSSLDRRKYQFVTTKKQHENTI